ncbi:hypothetical protein DB354_06100 [Opitutus sp. ER46]|nr:hypothetical protein DB354_06100 [Opitutus sp. ER46]
MLALLAAYHNAFTTPFVFDDVPSIVENTTLRRLWPLTDVVWPQQPGGLTTSGRPLVNLSFAVNHAISGNEVWSYHLANFLIHAGATLALFGLVRRTLARRGDPAALTVSFLVAGLWGLHPLQTESVTYIVQRAEALAGLGVLLTLYCFVRAVDGAAAGGSPAWRRGWAVGAVIACAGAMASKEVAVATPLLVLLYDRTFVAGSFGAAWRARRGFYLGLAATWVLLAVLVAGTSGRGGTAGFTALVTPWAYALTQCEAIVRYLWLAVWPQGLTFDYGTGTVQSLGAVLPQTLFLVLVIAATVVALKRAPVLGFLGAWFFALLAPSSSFVPVVTQTAAEHRMYLPLAAVVALVVIAALRRWPRAARWPLAALMLAAVAATAARNQDYTSEASLWADTVAKRPGNPRAHNNLGQARYREGRRAEAEACYRRALALKPDYPEPHYNLGVAFADRGAVDEAIQAYETALRLLPAYPEAENNLGNALAKRSDLTGALKHYEAALRLKPDFAEAQNNVGNALLGLGRPADALPYLQRARELRPGYAEASYNLGNACAALGDMPGALAQYREALALNPKYLDAHVNAGNALLSLGQPANAAREYETALTIDPARWEARQNLGLVLVELGRFDDAVPPLEAAVRATPTAADARRALGFSLLRLGRAAEAIPHYEAYLRLVPGDAEAQAELAQARALRR